MMQPEHAHLKSDLILSDMHVEKISDALDGFCFDWIVSGSIAAVESVKHIRSLRRLGAKVQPWITEGGAQFVTPISLAWAAHTSVRSEFEGENSHLAQDDACIVAPASANFIYELANQHTSTAPLALIHSYFGAQKQVFLLPTMHSSLWNDPALQACLKKLQDLYQDQLILLPSLKEESKLKLPAPEVCADQISHFILSKQNKSHIKKVLITLGGTQEEIDPVRVITNKSSGRTGSLIAEELYRLGYQTHILAAHTIQKPRCYSSLEDTFTHQQMLNSLQRAKYDAIICAAAISDYQPELTSKVKIKSSEESLTLNLKRTSKLLAHIDKHAKFKLAFKLETNKDFKDSKKLLQEYIEMYNLSGIVFNMLADVHLTQHYGVLLTQSGVEHKFSSKTELAKAIASILNSY